MHPSRHTPKQLSFFAHKPSLLLYFLYHLPRCPNRVPGIILNSPFSPNPRHQSLTKFCRFHLSVPQIRHFSWRPCWGSGHTSPQVRPVTCPLPLLHPPSVTITPAQALAGSLTSEPLHTSRFPLKSLTVAGKKSSNFSGWDVLLKLTEWKKKKKKLTECFTWITTSSKKTTQGREQNPELCSSTFKGSGYF